jgi:hypothetical protein
MPVRFLAFALATLAMGTTTGAKPANENAQFRQWLANWLSKSEWSADPDLSYGYALADLNGDGRREALAWVSAHDVCGTGGCILNVFANGKAGWKLVSTTVVTRPPIRVLSSKTKGWRDLGVIEAGGGIERPYEGRLQFDGKRYDVGWTDRKVAKRAKGRVVITDAAIPLFSDKCRKTQEAWGGVLGPQRLRTGKPGSC